MPLLIEDYAMIGDCYSAALIEGDTARWAEIVKAVGISVP